MTKKRRGKSNTTEDASKQKVLKLKDPDPTSSEYMYDKIDMYHIEKNSDKILLDPSAERDSDDDLQENMDEEVLPLQDSDDEEEEDADGEEEDEDEDEDEDEGSDSEDDNMFEESDEERVNDKAWGRHKKVFYNTDVQDDDVYTSDEEAQQAAQEEEKEAIILQKRLAEKLDAEDFYTFDDEEGDGKVKADEDDDDDDEDDGENEGKVKVAKDLSKLSKRERLEILADESPELLPLVEEYKDKLVELCDRYHPLVVLVKNSIIPCDGEGGKFVLMKHQLLLNYLINLSFYLTLKASKERTKGHPVLKVLVQHQQLLTQMQAYEDNLHDEIEQLLDTYKQQIVEGTLTNTQLNTQTSKQTAKSSVVGEETKPKKKKKQKKQKEEENEIEANIDPLEYYNLVKSTVENAKSAKRLKLDTAETGNDVGNDDDVEVDEEGKRMITYEMSKNKGLIRNRRKELKNPRVKHKMKFKKAVVKRKGQVREVQREINRYGGETTGIKASLARSTKIK